AVLGFQLDKSNGDKYYYSAKIVDEFDNEVLYDKLSYKMLVLPNFDKPREALPSILDQWMYLLKHSHEMNQLSNYLDKRIFSRIFEIGEVANLTPEEHMAYISSLDRKRDYNNTLAYAKKEGREEGEEKKNREFVRNLILEFDFNDAQAAKAAEVSIDFVEKIRASLLKGK